MLSLLEEWRENVVGEVLMDPSKAFDCVPPDILLAKIAAYDVDESESIISIATF